jgi:hypothetical protein
LKLFNTVIIAGEKSGMIFNLIDLEGWSKNLKLMVNPQKSKEPLRMYLED